MNKRSETGYPLPLKITGIGCYIPRRVVTSKKIEDECNLEQGWCAAHLGVIERRRVEDETPSFMGAEAAREALANAEMDMEEINLIISASGTAGLEQGLPDEVR